MQIRVALGAFLGVGACVAAASCHHEGETDAVDSTEEALRRIDVAGNDPLIADPPPPKPDAGRPPRRPPLSGGTLSTEIAPAPTTYCGETRFELRRSTRSCESLPGVFLQNGVSYVPGTNGRFRVERMLAQTAAPPALQEKTCAYIWEPISCSAPDQAKLLVEPTSEKLFARAPGCQYLPNQACDNLIIRIDGGIPNGSGVCEVCGFSSDGQLWTVLPNEWQNPLVNPSSTISYWVNGQRFQQPIQSFAAPYAVPSTGDQSVRLYSGNRAPSTPPTP